MSDEPLLGLATTEELIRELICRNTVSYPFDQPGQFAATRRALILAEMLGGLGAPEREYRTVDG